MLPGITPMVAGGGRLPDITYIGNTSNMSTLTTYTFSNVDIGAPASDRVVIIAVATRRTASFSISSATIGGFAASSTAVAYQGSRMGVCFIYALVQSGTAATVSITFSGSVEGCSIFCYRAIKLQSTSPTATLNDLAGGTALGVDIPVSANGFVVAIAATNTNTASYAWTGIAKDADVNDGSNTKTAASARFTASQTVAVRAVGAGTNSSRVLTATAWR
jgi:hypothetical protein